MRSARIAGSLVATVAISLGLAGAAAGGNGHGKGQNAAGPPVPDPAGIIDLPAGYWYDIRPGERAASTRSPRPSPAARSEMPADFDANITVPGKGGTVQLLSAHELTKPVPGDFQGDAGKCKVDEQATTDDGDSDGTASVSRLTLGRDGTTVTKRELITTGLHDLCAGAKTPWGTLLVNEEFPFIVDPQSRSGWVWEIDPETGAQKRATGMGRMSHEQEALSRGAWYITDDRGNFQYLYKFVPDKRRDLSTGKLYGLKFDRSTNTGEWVGPLDPMRPEADMAERVGPPTAANSFSKHEGIVKAKRGNGVVFSESGVRHRPRPDLAPHRPQERRTRQGAGRGQLREAEPSGQPALRPQGQPAASSRTTRAATSPTIRRSAPTTRSTSCPRAQTGAQNLRKFAQVRGGGEGTGPWFSRNGKILYLSIQDQPRPDGSQSRVLAIHVPKGHGHGHEHGSRGRSHKH